MEPQDVLDLPFPGSDSGLTVGEVVENLQKASRLGQKKSQDLASALRVAEGERDECLGRIEELQKQIDSVKILDLLTRSSLTAKLQITEDSDLGKVLAEALTTSLRGALGHFSG